MNGSSQSVVECPITTLKGHGDLVTTGTSNGTIVNCCKL
jgi:hypothetical protein